MTAPTFATGLRRMAKALLLCAAMIAGPANSAQPQAPGREVFSAPVLNIVMLPAQTDCGTTRVARSDGTLVEVPRHGQFKQNCVTVTTFSRANVVLSTVRQCSALEFAGCQGA